MNILHLTASGSIFILAIAAFRALALRRLPKGTFVALWWAAALRLLIPLSLPSHFSVYTLLSALRPKAVPSAPVPIGTVPVRIVPAPPPAAAVPPTETAPFPVWTALWLAGAVLLALLFLTRYIRWRRRFREALPAECPGLETCLRSHRKVRLRVTNQIAAPLTYGLLRPVILLPGTLDLRDEEAVTCVLAHEMVHIRRLDGLFKLALSAALCLHWFNPAVWLLYVLASRDLELRCDEAAVLALGEDSRERYALTLIKLAETQSAPLCGFAHRNGMEERIKAIMRVKRKSLLACFVALALVLGITTAFATSAKTEEAPPDIPDRELLAAASAEAAAQWEQDLAPYEAFGLSWSFEDPDLDGNGLTMTYEGREVRGIFDGKRGIWLTEHSGNGTYAPDAVELYAMYDDNGLTGLRFASEEEQAAFTQSREAASRAGAVEALGESLTYANGKISFTIPQSEGRWNIWISGRVMTEDGMGMSVHYLENESERGEWVPGETYTFPVENAPYAELSLEASLEGSSGSFDLTELLPRDMAPLSKPVLPEGKADVPEDGTLIWPVDSDEITSHFGERTAPGGKDTVNHDGVDIGGLAAGSPVYAAAAGTVDAAGYESAIGYYVVLLHANQVATTYSHCESVLVNPGDQVKAGQTIATVGSTGRSTGPHLHFQVLVNNKLHNPLEYFSYGDVAKSVSGTTWRGEGYPVYAVDDGRVTDAGWDEEYGYYVEVYQSDTNYKRPSNRTRYSNLGAIHVQPGKAIKQGDILGNEGVDPLRVEYDVESLASIRRMEALAETYLVNGEYPKNSKGQTYGPLALYSVTGTMPDLERVVLGEGEYGYVDPHREWERNPETGEWELKDAVRGSNGYLYVPVYDSEGNEIDLMNTWQT